MQGQSAGAKSVSFAITRRNSTVAPFHAGIMLSGVDISSSTKLKPSTFDAFAIAMGCTQKTGPLRLQCLRKVPASTIRKYTNKLSSRTFSHVVDKYAFYSDKEDEVLITLVV
jgi:carboxylesterase type B